MKKVLLLLLLSISLSCFSQGQKYVYSYALWGPKNSCVHYVYDSAPESKYAMPKNYLLKDKEGNVMHFRLDIEFVNYLAEQGWELMQAVYTPNISAGGEIYYYFKKPQSEFTKEELDKIIKK